jgi:hypothetical protein
VAVLVEAISVIIRRSSIKNRYSGGWSSFVSSVPNATLCYDDTLVRIGFISPYEVREFIDGVSAKGLKFIEDGRCIDLAVVDQQRGMTRPCDWLEFGRLPFGEAGGQVSACWLFEGERRGWGLHFRGKSMTLAVPVCWKYEGSLSNEFTFIPHNNAG